jgi:RNA polymerase sigma factor (TIGR02999 family)
VGGRIEAAPPPVARRCSDVGCAPIAGGWPGRASPMSEVTRILSAIDQGDPTAAEDLLPLVYDELRLLADRKLAGEASGQTLQATALVHDAYLRLVDVEEARHWNSRGHFFAAAAEAMRRILVEAARRKGSRRRGGERRRCELLDGDLVTCPVNDELLDLDEALSKLGSADAQAAEVVKLRVFAGMTVEEVAEHLGISPRTTKRCWAYARAWLGRELAVHPGSGP